MAKHRWHKAFVRIWMIAVLIIPTALAAPLQSIKSVRLWRAPDHTRLVFDLSGQIDHKLFSVSNPDRLVIDIQNTDLQADLKQVEIASTPIIGLRSGRHGDNDLRIVLDLSTAVKPRSFTLPANEQYGDRLVIDLHDIGVETQKTVDDIIPPGGRDIIIAIDAGHGGEDPGAIGPQRIQEKKVVLAISRRLKEMVDGRKGYEAVLVRTGDYYIPLRQRPELARKQRADLMISIHADAFKKPQAHGASVFALSQRGATSETARYLAERENRADLIGGIGSVSLADKDAMLAGVLLDLSMTATLTSSLEVGAEVLKSVGSVANLHKRHVEQAGFVVLKSPDIPSILVETGFISNPGEARNLNSSSHQKKLAAAIFSGVRRYFEHHPPQGTWLAANKPENEREHIISRGDTLSDIARRYNVSIEDLLRYNKLRSTQIQVGQRLKIPVI